ncbi:hypothetical protein SAMN05720470_109104 [Fibrobacter sp. UWOV1]|uniref:hypothetical protein n=1 Tax=Fibrobacter sp. UWOV1 TaxID=1896215 RepID=UPI000911271A|nr:hypothetical protein [Fibrobacter sp. UWOV1]SHL54220.1 hypothetical protein SAMN05720470_109104 [Fibrobacter sp. UWOV1]
MFTKKVILPVAALAMTALVGCGDDSSSSGPSSNVAPASVPTLEDALKLTCSATENFCAKVFVEEEMIRDTMQCDGKAFTPMMLGKPVAGCENAAPADPAAETPADPAAETPADPAAETPADPAAETPADPAAETPADPAAETPADPAAETPADPAAETPADPAAETPADPAAETPADPAAETPADPAGPAAGGATCYMASDIPDMAECIPVTQEQCATIAGEWVEACPVN